MLIVNFYIYMIFIIDFELVILLLKFTINNYKYHQNLIKFNCLIAFKLLKKTHAGFRKCRSRGLNGLPIRYSEIHALMNW